MHCEYNDAQPDRFSHGRRVRDVLYARTIIYAHHLRLTCTQLPCARLLRIMSPTILPRHYARRPQRTLRLHNYQCAPSKLSVPPTILSRRYAPSASVQSCSRLTVPHAFGLPAIVVGWTWFATSTALTAAAGTATTTMHSPAHRRLRHALRIQ
jgi:hypothetical protein